RLEHDSQGAAGGLEVLDDAILDVQGRAMSEIDSDTPDAASVDDQAAQADDIAGADADVDGDRAAQSRNSCFASSVIGDADRLGYSQTRRAAIVTGGENADLAAGVGLIVRALEARAG